MTPTPLPSVRGSGPLTAKIAIVTEYATADDIWKGYPLAGASGDFANKLLHEAGIIRSECYVIPVIRTRITDPNLLYTKTKSKAQKLGLSSVLWDVWVAPSLPKHIAALHEALGSLPNLTAVIALGDLAMFALTGIYGSVDTWRGSLLGMVKMPGNGGESPPVAPAVVGEYQTTAGENNHHHAPENPPAVVIPTYPPAALYKQWAVKSFCVRDLQRAKILAERPELYNYPAYQFRIRPTFSQTTGILLMLLGEVAGGRTLKLSVDIETIARRISCIGFAWNVREALCIPFMTLDGHYWPEEEEIEISFLMKELLTHPNVEVIGQNFNYDNQYFARYLGYLPNQTFDTMIAQHVLFPGIPKSLGFLSSMYCHYHRYWKDEINDYTRLPENMDQYWTYNCKDVVTTYEIAMVLENLLDHVGRRPQYEFMQATARSALRTMLLGMRIDQKSRSEIAGQLMNAIMEYETLIQEIVGFPLNVSSPKQMQEFFYGDLKLPVQIDRKTKRPTLNAKAMAALAEKEPLLRPLVELIEKKRSLGVFLSTFCLMPLDTDGRMRCSFNVCGAETMRFSSSENAFGTGGNLQNIPKGEK